MLSSQEIRSSFFVRSSSSLFVSSFVNVRNVGTMTRDQTAELSREICGHITRALGVPADRVFIEFGDAVDYQWGWNGETFA